MFFYIFFLTKKSFHLSLQKISQTSHAKQCMTKNQIKMKKLFTFISAMAMATTLFAQTNGGPDAFGYVWRTNADPNGQPYSWIDINQPTGGSAVTVSGLADDNIVGPFTMPIPFHYYWYDPLQFWIGSNGYIGFTSGTLAAAFPAIPLNTGAQNFIAPFASDITFVGTGGNPVPGASCKYWTNNVDTLIVTWDSVPFWDQPAPGYQGLNSFQVILSTVDSSITFNYLLQQSSSNNALPGVLSSGIENNSGNVGLQYLFDVYPPAASNCKYYYPAATSFAVNDAASSYVNNPGTKAIFLSRNGAPYQSMAQVSNTGNQALAGFNSYSRVVNAGNVIQVRDTVLSGALTPGQSQLITYPDLWTPTVAGTYRHINVTQLVGDATPTNNIKELELDVVDTTLTDIRLVYNNGFSGGTGISWLGGGGGVGYYWIPPFTPCYLNKAEVQILADNTGVGFHIQVYDDDGPNGTPGTMLDSIFVAPGTFTIGALHTINMTQPILISSGGFYIAWMMGGADIALDQDAINPYSNRSFEILGPASNPLNWAEYRNNEFNEPMLNAVISNSPLGVEQQLANGNSFGICSPNPASAYTRIDYTLAAASKNLVCTIYNTDGKLVAKKSFGKMGAGKGSLFVDLTNVNQGMYIVKISDGENMYHTKLSVIK